jgi:cytochrome c oxidase subunit 2
MRRSFLKLFAVAVLLGSIPGVQLLPQAAAQTLENQHAKSPKKGAQVHAEGVPPPDVSFVDKYPPPKSFSSFGHRVDWLFKYTSWVAFIFFVIMVSLLAWFMWAYRERPGHKAYYTHGKASSGEKWLPKIGDLAVFVSLDIVIIGATWIHTRDFIWAYPKGDDVVKVQVMPQQWAWNFRYAGIDGVFNTDDDIVTVNDMRIPKDKPIMVQLKSRDVIHGFYVQNARLQIDAIPAQVTKMWFDAKDTGDFEIACVHLCGTAHYKMKAFLKVYEQSDFDSWYQESSNWAKAAFDKDDPTATWGWNWSLYQ